MNNKTSYYLQISLSALKVTKREQWHSLLSIANEYQNKKVGQNNDNYYSCNRQEIYMKTIERVCFLMICPDKRA